MFGKEDLLTIQSAAINTIAQMAEVALFTTQKNITINNTEGAIVLQLLMQVMRGTTALNEIFQPILDRLKQRLYNHENEAETV